MTDWSSGQVYVGTPQKPRHKHHIHQLLFWTLFIYLEADGSAINGTELRLFNASQTI